MSATAKSPRIRPHVVSLPPKNESLAEQINSSKESDIFSFGIEPNKLFDRVLFDPRMDESLRDAYREALESLGCDVEVRRSTLYDPPENMRIKIPG